MPDRPPIVIEGTVYQLRESDIKSQRTGLYLHRTEDPVEALKGFTDPVAFVCRGSSWDDSYLEELPTGSWVTTTGVGYDGFPIEAFTEQGIAFTNNPGITAEQTAEHVFGMVFAFTRQLLSYRDNQRAHEWNRWPGMTDLAGADCAIVGLGGIGEAVAKRAKAFEMSVRGVKRSIEGYDGSADMVYPPSELRDSLRDARLVVLSVPLTERTRYMIGSEELAAISNDGVIINVSRGQVVETQALVDALSDGELRAAGLDVTDPEPLPSDSPLWDRRDVLITPHCAGASENYRERFIDRFLKQYERWQEDGELRDRHA